MKRFAILFAIVANTAFGSAFTIGPNGIDSKSTGLDGSLGSTFAVGIGMAEQYRSAKADYDSASFSAPNTFPYAVYNQATGGTPPMDQVIAPDDHATWMAGVMVGKATPSGTYEGVAPGARLHSVAMANWYDENLAVVALNNLALLNVTPKIVAINLSWGFSTDFVEEDGRSLLTQFIDWSARRHDVLYVTAFAEFDETLPSKPDDNYNGITVGSSGLNVAGDSFETFGPANADPSFFVGTQRTYIDLLAPGESVEIYGRNASHDVGFGTSFSAAHVTGAVALLHQYRDQQSMAGNERFFGTPKHYTTKAILMNSADKLAGVHGSSRDITNHLGQKWDQTDAYADPYVPLDSGMGAGHLNVSNAVTQLSPGRYIPTGGGEPNVPLIGWAEGNISFGESDEYIMEDSIPGNSWVAITLCWDRVVEHSGGLIYHYGDQFFPYDDPYDRMPDLDLYLVGADSNTVFDSSISFTHNEEHIFYKSLTGGRFRIVVQHAGGLEDDAGYGLAWWLGDASGFPPGDYNKNGSVGPEDFDVWKSNFGTNFAAADGNGDGIVNAADYTVWRNNLGASINFGSGSVSSVPEPSCGLLLMLIGIVGLASHRSQKLR